MESQLRYSVVSTQFTLRRLFLGVLWLGFSMSTVNASNCVENGGSMVCAAKDKFGTPWTYDMCDGSGSGGYKSSIRLQCIHWYDGEWVFREQYNNYGCENEQNRPMTDPDDASLMERAMNYDRDGNTCDITATMRWATDGEPAGYYWCWGERAPTYSQGIEVTNMASLVVTDQHENGETGECTGSVTNRGIAVSRNRSVGYACPEGYEKRYYNATEWECVRPINNSCDVGNPISPGDGCKTEVSTDYDGHGNGLTLTRHYSSLGYLYQPLGATDPRYYPLGDHWHTNFDRRLFPISGSVHTMASVERSDGTVHYFRPDGSEAHNVRGNQQRLEKLTGATVELIGWRLLTADQTLEEYDAAGRLQTITPRSGPKLTLTYSGAGTPVSVAPFADLLIAVTTHFGHALRFTYDAQGRLITMTDPEGRIYQYVFIDDNLTQVIYPDDTPGDDSDNPRRIYHYDDPTFLHHLTGITDENGDRFATYAYDPNSGKAVVTGHAQTVNAGPQEQYTLTYDSDTQTTVTDAAGTVEVLTFEENLGIKNLVSRVNQSDGKGISQVFDANNNLEQRIDEEGRVTKYTYNASNQRETMIEAFGTSWERTTRYEHVSPDIDLVTKVTTPSVVPGLDKEVITTYTADGKFNVESVTENGYRPDGFPVSRTTSFQYNASGQVTRIDGPRTDVADITTLAYYDDPGCTTGDECGQLQSVTNALGHVTTYDIYDAHGRVTRMTDPVGVATRYNYDARGRVLQVEQTPPSGQGAVRTTLYTYYGVMDQVKTVTTPGGVTLTYTYDAAHDLRSITDNAGNTIEYTYDQKGNRTREVTKDPNGTLVGTVQTAYDLRNRVASINAAGSVTQTIHDAVGNLVSETDPNQNPSTTHSYDVLDRLRQTLDSLGKPIGYAYDVQDRLTQVQAPNNATTIYQYDDLGNLLQETSVDRGTRTSTYDSAGNVLALTDGRGVTVTYDYDALNRLNQINYAGTEEDVRFTFDACTHGIGRLCQIRDQSGTTDYIYDVFGNVHTHSKTELGVVYVTEYGYDAGDRLLSVIYPDGSQVTYARDAVGRITALARTQGGVTTTLANQISYRADGLMTGQTLGNGLVDGRTYDLQGRLTHQSVGAEGTRVYTHDANGNIKTVDTAAEDRNFSYDALDRLVQDALVNAGVVDYGYDANGNRLTENAADYTYEPDSNRLTGVAGQAVSLDAAGNTTALRDLSFVYNQAGRVASVTRTIASGGKGKGKKRSGTTETVSYVYNVQGLRTRKIASTGTMIYHYDIQGQLLTETDAAGNTAVDYVWLEAAPLAQIRLMTTTVGKGKGKNKATTTITEEILAYVHADHLNTPRLATDSAATVLWRWDSDGFGTAPPAEDADGDGIGTTINLRFPGQYYDRESGLHYNWNRYYDPKIGRYITSDPIGLEGGLNIYLYVSANPLAFSDPYGLVKIYGNWCGPDWTGGKEKPWNKFSDKEKKNAEKPIDQLDKCCRTHDLCYANCREQFSCDSDMRQKCFQDDCDRTLSNCAGGTSDGGIRRWGIEQYMKRSEPGAEENDPSCRRPKQMMRNGFIPLRC